MHAATGVRREVEYQGANAAGLAMDIYYPPDAKTGSRIPAVVFVTGYPDPGFQKVVGCKQKEMGSYVSWAPIGRLPPVWWQSPIRIARQQKIFARCFNTSGKTLRLWALMRSGSGYGPAPGNVPGTRLSLLMREQSDPLKCAVLCYGFMLDLEGSAGVAKAARQWGFANPCVGSLSMI